MVKSDFSSCISKYSGSVQNDASLEGNWNVLKGALLKATNGSCGWTKDPDIKKRSGELMTLVIVLVRSRNYGANVNRETQVRNSI